MPELPPATATLVHAAGRPADVVAFETAVVSFFVEAASLLGVPKSVAAIYGICFASAEPLGFTEIDERLDISSGSISQGLKFLRELGALKVVVAPLEKRDRYTPDMELRKLVSHFLEERLERQLSAGKGRLDAIHAAVPAGDNGSARELKARVKALQSWNSKGRSLVPVMKTFLKLT
jgi:HTH-type transcriptional regulator, glycine betaine synthesis regulator